ncbi:hypothetical protein Acr_00g0058130 [Actinidia rufa]|uniref:Uncharacterized protein n=1 Tax=Actinidia rufa TaxID=165716 RepID=A0A7J0DPT8_9ERIC|nr:hypothetical protein Acr_00g0058130 [Actinidia rufa]
MGKSTHTPQLYTPNLPPTVNRESHVRHACAHGSRFSTTVFFPSHSSSCAAGPASPVEPVTFAGSCWPSRGPQQPFGGAPSSGTSWRTPSPSPTPTSPAIDGLRGRRRTRGKEPTVGRHLNTVISAMTSTYRRRSWPCTWSDDAAWPRPCLR